MKAEPGKPFLPGPWGTKTYTAAVQLTLFVWSLLFVDTRIEKGMAAEAVYP
jgi:hypothetical protein